MRTVSLYRNNHQQTKMYCLDELLKLPFIKYPQTSFQDYIICLNFADYQQLGYGLQFLAKLTPTQFQQNLLQNEQLIGQIKSFIDHSQLLINTDFIPLGLTFIHTILQTKYSKQLIPNTLINTVFLFLDTHFAISLNIIRRLINKTNKHIITEPHFITILTTNLTPQNTPTNTIALLNFANVYFDAYPHQLTSQILETALNLIKTTQDPLILPPALQYLLLYTSAHPLPLNSLFNKFLLLIDDFQLEILQILEIQSQRDPNSLMLHSFFAKLDEIIFTGNGENRSISVQILLNLTHSDAFSELFIFQQEKYLGLLKSSSSSVSCVFELLSQLIELGVYQADYEDLKRVLGVIDGANRNKRRGAVESGFGLLVGVCESEEGYLGVLEELGVQELAERVCVNFGEDGDWGKFL